MLSYIRENYFEDLQIKNNIVCKTCNLKHIIGIKVFYCVCKHEYCSKCINDNNIKCLICKYLLL